MITLPYPIPSFRQSILYTLNALISLVLISSSWAASDTGNAKPLIPADSGTRIPTLPDYNSILPDVKPARILKVGPAQTFPTPSSAAAIAKDGDIIEIEAGIYPADAAIWKANYLTIRGIGGRAHLRADGVTAQGKAIWVINGENITVENIEFSGAKVSDQNGGGIRHQGGNLTIRNCFFHHNENGILTNKHPTAEILIENSEFAHNGYGDGRSHNMYIGAVKKFTLRYSYSHHANVGHNVKTRAKENYILYNRLMDEADGNSSYIVQFPNGGQAVVLGNLLQQGPKAPNYTMVSFGDEGIAGDSPELYVVNNTFVNERGNGEFIRTKGNPAVKIVNNIFFGKGTPTSDDELGEVKRNLITTENGFVNLSAYDYRLRQDSLAIDKAIDPGIATTTIFSLIPTFQYIHPTSEVQRPDDGSLDLGAYEFQLK